MLVSRHRGNCWERHGGGNHDVPLSAYLIVFFLDLLHVRNVMNVVFCTQNCVDSARRAIASFLLQGRLETCP